MNTEKTENRDERKLGRIAAEGTVNCPSCAANFSAKLPRCPYCGTMYLPASETEFMDKLDGIREDLGGIGDRIVQETRKNSRLLWKRLAAAGAAVLVLIAAVLIAGASARKREAARDSETTTEDIRHSLHPPNHAGGRARAARKNL